MSGLAYDLVLFINSAGAVIAALHALPAQSSSNDIGKTRLELNSTVQWVPPVICIGSGPIGLQGQAGSQAEALRAARISQVRGFTKAGDWARGRHTLFIDVPQVRISHCKASLLNPPVMARTLTGENFDE